MNSSLMHRLEQALDAGQIETVDGTPVVRPLDIAVLAETMRLVSSERGTAAVVGGETALSPACSESSVRISLTGLSGIREVNPGDFLAIAGAGATVDSVESAARAERLLVPLDITSGMSATVGGAYMTDAVAPYAAGYGPFRDYVLGAKCVTAQGDVVTLGGRTMKNVTGYEITRFLAGTRGMFVIAAELVIKALPLPERRMVLVARFEGGDPADTLADIGSAGSAVKRCDIFPEDESTETVLLAVGVEGMEAMTNRAVEVVRAAMERAGAGSVREETPSEYDSMRRNSARRMTGTGMVTLSVPPPASSALYRRLRHVFPGMRVIAHPLLGRMHVLAEASEIARLREMALAVGGKQPADWNRMLREGIQDLFTPKELKVAQALKRELDPGKVLNPHLRLE